MRTSLTSALALVAALAAPSFASDPLSSMSIHPTNAAESSYLSMLSAQATAGGTGVHPIPQGGTFGGPMSQPIPTSPGAESTRPGPPTGPGLISVSTGLIASIRNSISAELSSNGGTIPTTVAFSSPASSFASSVMQTTPPSSSTMPSSSSGSSSSSMITSMASSPSSASMTPTSAATAASSAGAAIMAGGTSNGMVEIVVGLAAVGAAALLV